MIDVPVLDDEDDPIDVAAADLIQAIADLFDFEWTDDTEGDLRHLQRMTEHVHRRILENDTVDWDDVATD